MTASCAATGTATDEDLPDEVNTGIRQFALNHGSYASGTDCAALREPGEVLERVVQVRRIERRKRDLGAHRRRHHRPVTPRNAGQKVGSTVAVAMVPADGYPEGRPAAGIQPGDTLIFAIKILEASR